MTRDFTDTVSDTIADSIGPSRLNQQNSKTSNPRNRSIMRISPRPSTITSLIRDAVGTLAIAVARASFAHPTGLVLAAILGGRLLAELSVSRFFHRLRRWLELVDTERI